MALTIANQAALAIENASLFSEAKRRLEHLTSLRRIDEVITSNLDLRLTLNIILGQIRQQLEVDAAVILIYQPELQSLEYITGQGFQTQAMQFSNLRLGEGFAGRAALEKRIIQISDLDQLKTGFLRSPDFRKEGFSTYIGAPLSTKGMVSGVLEIYHRRPLSLIENGWLSLKPWLGKQPLQLTASACSKTCNPQTCSCTRLMMPQSRVGRKPWKCGTWEPRDTVEGLWRRPSS